MIVAAVERFDDAAFGVLAPEIRHAFHLSKASYVAVATLTSVLPLVLAVFIGYLGDRGNRVHLSRIGATVWAVTAIATGLAPVIFWLVVARLFGGVGLLVNEPTHASLLADYYPPRSLGSVFAGYRFGSSGVALAAAPLAGLLATVFNWRVTFVTLAIPTLVMVVVMAGLREPARGESLALSLPHEELPTVGEGYRRVRSIFTLRRTWVAAFLFGGATVPFDNLLSLYLDEVFHMSAAARGVVTGVFGVCGLGGIVIGGLFARQVMKRDRADLLPVVIAGMGIEFAIGITLMAVAPTRVLAIGAIMLLSIGYSGFLPAYQTLVSLISPPRLRSQAFAWSLLWYGVGAITVGTTIGAIGDAHGQRVALVVLAVLVAAAAITESTCRGFVDRDVRQAITVEEASKSSALLACRGLDVGYDGVQVLFGVDFEIQAGEMVALLGTNGAGKSTFLKAISGLLDPDAGAIFYRGRDITHADANVTSRLGIVQVPGGRGIFPALSVAENLRVAGWLYRRDPGYVREGIAKVRSLFPLLTERWNQLGGALSGGEQQMLALAQSFLAQPKLLLIDELSLGLAPTVVDRLLDVVRVINETGVSVILVEQSVNNALRLASRAVFMEKGEVRFSGPTADLLARPDILRAVFLGRDPANAPSSDRASSGRASASPEGGASKRSMRRASKPTTVRERKHPSETPRPSRAQIRRRAALLEAPAVLEARGVTKRYGGIAALSDVDLSLHEGEILGVIGPNGAGKTTLFDVISGFATPEGGSVWLHGRDVTGWSASSRGAAGLGRSFQDAGLFPSLTVRETLAVACERSTTSRGVLPAALRLPAVAESERAVHREVERIIDLLGLGAYVDKFIAELSTGSRRIVELGVILAHSPSVVILDEPSSGIAQREAEALGPLLGSVRAHLDASLLVVEHDMALIAGLADHLVALDQGRVVTGGLPNEVLSHPVVIESYLGTDRGPPAREHASRRRAGGGGLGEGSSLSELSAARKAVPGL